MVVFIASKVGHPLDTTMKTVHTASFVTRAYVPHMYMASDGSDRKYFGFPLSLGVKTGCSAVASGTLVFPLPTGFNTWHAAYYVLAPTPSSSAPTLERFPSCTKMNLQHISCNLQHVPQCNLLSHHVYRIISMIPFLYNGEAVGQTTT